MNPEKIDRLKDARAECRAIALKANQIKEQKRGIAMQDMKDAFQHYLYGVGEFEGLGCKNVAENYNIRTPSAEQFGIVIEGKTSYEQNIKLKKKLNEFWSKAAREKQLELSYWVVKEWGGIKTNTDRTMEKHFRNCSRENPELGYEGMASYTKILMAKDSSNYAIYDSRVSVALNAIQLICNVARGCFFTYVDGRAKVINEFQQHDKYKKSNLKKEFPNWDFPHKDDVYPVYLALLKDLSLKTGFSISEIEMALFSDAKELAGRLMKS